MTRSVGWICLAGAFAVVVLLPLVSPHDPLRADGPGNQPPGSDHLFGTDRNGRDVLARVAAGARSSLATACIALVTLTLLGGVVGGAAAFAGGATDRLLVSVVDLFLSFPRFILLVTLAALMPSGSSMSVGLLIGLTSWMSTARLVRTETLSLRERPFVEAARASGVSGLRILSRHVAPHLVRVLLESAGIRLGGAIVADAGLGFLGIGVSADAPTWGNMLREGQTQLLAGQFWVVLPPLLTLCAVSVGLVLVSEKSVVRS